MTDEVGGDCGCCLFCGFFLVAVDDGLDAVVKFAAGEGAEVEVGGEEGCRLRGEGCRGGVGFGECRGVAFIRDDFVKL